MFKKMGFVCVCVYLQFATTEKFWHILLTCSDFIEIRESYFTAKSLRMLFQDILPEKIFNFYKEINIFGFFKI